MPTAEEFIASLKTGKEDKPVLLPTGAPVYDFHDIDGLYYMLDQKLSSCMVFLWSKPMDSSVMGKVTVDGKEMRGCVLQYMPIMHFWILGIPLRGAVTEYEKPYALHVEGFTDADGNMMEPADMAVTGPEKVAPDPKYAEHEQVALQAAREGIVLLRNERNALPLKPGTLNLFGQAVHQFRITAVGAGKINPRYSVNFLEAVRSSQDFSLNEELVEFYGSGTNELPGLEALKRAVELSDTAIFFISRASGENQDQSSAKGDFYLTDEEDALVKALTERFPHVVAVLNVGYPIDVTWAERYGVDGLVHNGFGGMLAGPALLDILSGAETPSGKLPDTWARDYFDIPAAQNFYDHKNGKILGSDSSEFVDTVYEEDIYVGYRYFDTFRKKPAYPFGYGLSYTKFMIEAEKPFWDGGSMTQKIIVKNMGSRPGKEVVQVYIGKPESKIEKPRKELVFFAKTSLLAPGAVEEISVSIPKRCLTVYSEDMAAYLLEAGEYKVYVGNSGEADFCGRFTVEQGEIVKQVKNRMRPIRNFTRLSQKDETGTYPQGKGSGIVPGKETFLPYVQREQFPTEFTGRPPAEKLTFDAVRRDLEKASDYVAQMSVEELARVSVCANSGWGMEGVGEAGSVYSPENFPMPRFPVADGNSGVNLTVKNIGMPAGATLCASFNRELSEKVGRVIGEEAKELGIPLILAPALNIHRDPLNGRQPEYFSEDPYLAGSMAGQYAKGMESAGTASCIKHMICNNAESTRKRNQSIVSERAIREIYFRAFEYAMEVHMPASVMTAYNAVNGCPTAADSELILGLLREECGFDGFVMTDWGTYDTVDTAAMVQAGNCWITPGSMDDAFTKPIIDGVKNGTIDLARLQSNVASLVRVMARFS